jgi:hypothetical protein
MYRNTYVEREPGEKINDRNDRAIRVAVAWYGNHLLPSQADRRKGDRVRVIFLTDDAESKHKAESDGLEVATGMLFMWFLLIIDTVYNEHRVICSSISFLCFKFYILMALCYCCTECTQSLWFGI